MLYPVIKQAYKLELLKEWKIYNVFHMSLLKQDITKREQVEKMPELNTSNNDIKEYKMEAIQDSAIYAKKSESGHLLGFDYLVACKGYPREENT